MALTEKLQEAHCHILEKEEMHWVHRQTAEWKVTAGLNSGHDTGDKENEQAA